MLQFIRSKTYELAGGRRRLRDSPVLISGLISLEQEDTAGLLAGAAARLGRSRDPTREAAAPITCSSAARSAAQAGSRPRGPTPPARLLTRGPGKRRQRCPGLPPALGPRRAASSGATWRPRPPGPARASFPARDSRRHGCPAWPCSRLANSWQPAGPAIPMGTGPRRGPAWAGPRRPASLPHLAAGLAAGKGPGGCPSAAEGSVLTMGLGPRTSVCRGGGLQDCELQGVRENAAVAEPAGKTPALGVPPTPMQSVFHRHS